MRPLPPQFSMQLYTGIYQNYKKLFLIAKKQPLFDQILLKFDLDLIYLGQGRQTDIMKDCWI